MVKTLLTAVLLLLSASLVYGAVKTVGSKESLQFDATNFTPAMKANYEVVKKKCVSCHTQERLVVAITTGVGPITGQEFSGRSIIKGFGCKPKKGISPLKKEEIKAALDLANYLASEATQ